MAKLKLILPGWPGGPSPGGHERWNGRWNSRLDDVLEHLRTHGRFPVMGPSSSPEEYALGRWISVQRLAWKEGELYPERLAQLDERLPGWRDAKKSGRKDAKSGPVSCAGGRFL